VNSKKDIPGERMFQGTAHKESVFVLALTLSGTDLVVVPQFPNYDLVG
jgi:hypothetical protein